MPANTSFKDLPLWQRAMRLVIAIYKLTGQLPATERLGLSADLQKSATLLPTRLASGMKRGRAGLHSACLEGREIAAELETLLIIIQNVYPSIAVDEIINEVADLQHSLTETARRLTSGGKSKRQPAAPRAV